MNTSPAPQMQSPNNDNSGVAINNNIVQFSIHGTLSNCIALECSFKEKFGFQYCKVVPNLNENNAIHLKSLGIAGAEFINKQIHEGQHKLIGLGFGQTLSACVDYIPYRDKCDVEFVSLSGGLTPQFGISPYDVIHRIAYRTNAPSYIVPSLMYLPSIENKNSLLAQPEFQSVYNKMLKSSLKIVGIGQISEDTSMLQTSIWDKDNLLHVQKKGAVGEILGHFFNEEGEALELDYSDNMMNPTLDSIRRTDTIAIAGGIKKVSAITALSKSGYLNGLIIDEQTAQKIMEL